MLHPDVILSRIMVILKSIDSKRVLPETLKPFLGRCMARGTVLLRSKTLEWEHKIPKRAYYVAIGFVIVYGLDERGKPFPFRIYGRDTIVALNCFMTQGHSAFRIKACKGALVWSINAGDLKNLYQNMDGMELFALRAALDLGAAQEVLRANLLALEPELRIIEFYLLIFPELLPVKNSPIFDGEIAKFLDISLPTFRRIRRILLQKGELE
jgi:CRP-like cAMP-binding protein